MNRLRLKFSIGLFFLLSILTIGFNTCIAHAATGAGFSMMPQYPSNQVKGKDGSFFLQVKPGQTQKITVVVVNQENKNRTIRFGINTAYTTDNGSIAYDLADKYLPKDSSRKFLVGSFVQDPQVQDVKIGPKKAGTVSFTMKMPTTAFKGYLLGGIYAMPVGETSNTVTQKGTVLRNQYAYTLPITLTMDPTAELSLNLRLNTIRPKILSPVDRSVGIAVNVQNTNPTYIQNKLYISAKVTRKGSNKVIHSKTVDNSDFAPNSNYDFSISWGGQPLEPGKYHLSWKSNIGGLQNWNFERDFTISNADAQSLNNQAGFKPNYVWLWILLGVLALALIIIVTYYFGRKRNQKHAQANTNSVSSQRKR
ncbi:DUF916 and DUF3324 domain-containing protein [Schleiferilactobacillus harbinensis]|uniref:DUF916 and DUF3324 domain-containing protein n=1 Tax=Schleiferilactobacillus harbinensis TaxID=304207 RepID=UPI00345EA3C8